MRLSLLPLIILFTELHIVIFRPLKSKSQTLFSGIEFAIQKGITTRLNNLCYVLGKRDEMKHDLKKKRKGEYTTTYI